MNETKNNVVNLYKSAIDQETISKSINVTILEIKKIEETTNNSSVFL